MKVPLKVLIIEDDPRLGKTLADPLQQQGYEPLLASTGEEGIARMASVAGLIAVALVDLRLPDLDGGPECHYASELDRRVNPRLCYL